MQALDGMMVDGHKYDVEVTLGGYVKLLNGLIGLYGATIFTRAYTSSVTSRSCTRQRICGNHMVAFQCGI
jgi:hypothetical protein